ncbi:hypothetical protein, unlikely [Trypanosoma brucei gambiense DAL972]|uniref:Uncharacterized protein n=2 Tax=Trypanosoma brucei TaxID=5691 RepID=C9ZJV7_TRYB9|nr:hypothetical protein, unlikely [Trypanosoma brucei gambiense DAL972]RHW73419.1 hypothetical protein DPX39_030010800 [Trypanosoma brucei equiperdum]CBH09721.1 hypothetical protein, unlikely [Trypanosoma brucei gambiense DAL972]|eukprot:XP_011772014.1 hypothetical protein, unlikely [Trypanosoma brucei gambiense DAL972]
MMRPSTGSGTPRSDAGIKRSVTLGIDIMNEDSFWEISGIPLKSRMRSFISRERLTPKNVGSPCDLYLFPRYDEQPLCQSFRDLLNRHRSQLRETAKSYERYTSEVTNIRKKTAWFEPQKPPKFL